MLIPTFSRWENLRILPDKTFIFVFIFFKKVGYKYKCEHPIKNSIKRMSTLLKWDTFMGL